MPRSISTIGHCTLPTQWGEFRLSAFPSDQPDAEHCALSMGNVADGQPVLVRVHSECLTGDAFGSLRCDCGAQLHSAMEAIACAGRGALVYLRQEGRGIGLANKIRAYALQEKGADTVDANRLLGFPDDLRRYEDAKLLLSALRIASVRLMTNNPGKIAAMRELGITIVERVPIRTGHTIHNLRYLTAKAERMGHMMTDYAASPRVERPPSEGATDNVRMLARAHVS